MNKRTKIIAGIAAVLFVSAVIVVLLGLREIGALSDELSVQIEAIQTDRAQQEVFTQIQKISNDSQSDRVALEGYFLRSQSDSIDFLNFVEALGDSLGVDLTTLTPQEVERDNKTYLSVGYDISGSLSQVERFIQLLEVVPYVSQLQSVSLTQLSGSTWQAQVSVNVQILNYEN